MKPSTTGWETVPKRAARRALARQEEETTWPPSITLIHQDAINSNFRQFMLILIGIPGSGKSTFATLLETGKPWMFVRVNQDALGSRVACLERAAEVLRDGKCPIIDRCNFDRSQRATFLKLAHLNRIPVSCVVFQFPSEVCIRRCRMRSNHETITAENASRIVIMMNQQFSPPDPKENAESFQSIHWINSTYLFQDILQKYLLDIL